MQYVIFDLYISNTVQAIASIYCLRNIIRPVVIFDLYISITIQAITSIYCLRNIIPPVVIFDDRLDAIVNTNEINTIISVVN